MGVVANASLRTAICRLPLRKMCSVDTFLETRVAPPLELTCSRQAVPIPTGCNKKVR